MGLLGIAPTCLELFQISMLILPPLSFRFVSFSFVKVAICFTASILLFSSSVTDHTRHRPPASPSSPLFSLLLFCFLCFPARSHATAAFFFFLHVGYDGVLGTVHGFPFLLHCSECVPNIQKACMACDDIIVFFFSFFSFYSSVYTSCSAQLSSRIERVQQHLDASIQ